MASAEQSLVSIVTPLLNQVDYIGETIASIAAQRYPRVEHIVVDGGSTDGTLDVIRKAMSEGIPLRLISELDDGQADAIEKGFRLATGEIVTWLNGDDVYVSEEVVGTVVAVFVRYPDVNIVTGAGIHIDGDGRTIGVHPPPWRAAEQIRYKDVVFQSSTFFRAKVFETTRLDTSLHYAFDWDFFARAIERHHIHVIPESLGTYRAYGRNKSAAGGPQRTAELAEVTRRLLGSRAPQYRVLRTFTVLEHLIDRMPPALHGLLRHRLLYGVLFRGAYHLCGRRLQT